jgi:hypothetical protein
MHFITPVVIQILELKPDNAYCSYCKIASLGFKLCKFQVLLPDTDGRPPEHVAGNIVCMLGIIDQNYVLIIIPLFITQAPTCFDTYVSSSRRSFILVSY